MLGTVVYFEEGGRGMITDENESEIFIESDFCTGWMDKATYWDLLGIAD